MALTRAQIRRSLPVLVRFFRYAKRRRPINTEDPITQEKLSFPVFFHVTETNTFAFHAPTLIAYITATGDFRNPYTREEFNVVEVRRLQKHSQDGVDLASSILERQEKRRQDISRESLLNFLHSDCLSQVELCLDKLTQIGRPHNEIANDCLRGPCIEYIRSINQLVYIDRARAFDCVGATYERLGNALQDSRFVYDPFVFPAIVDFFKNVGRQIQAGQRFVGIIRR